MVRRSPISGVVVAAIVLLAPSAFAHDASLDPLDAFGGHICRPKGGGAADCSQFGLVPGEYHCETDACRDRLTDLAKGFCTFGIPTPTRSDLTGAYPTGDLAPPIRVMRRPGEGHVLEIRRDLFPQLQAPSACRNPDPGLVLRLPQAAANAHRDNPDRGAVRVADGPAPAPVEQASATQIVRLPDAEASSLPVPATTGALVAVALGLGWGAARHRRPRAHWDGIRGRSRLQ